MCGLPSRLVSFDIRLGSITSIASVMAPFWAWASDEREIVRHYTLSAADIKLVARTPRTP
jgi:hypothetical protein